LELFKIRIRVSCKGAKVLFYLREVSEGKGDIDPYNAFHSGHFPERVDGNWLTGGSLRVSVGGAHGVLWFWVGRRTGGRRGRRRDRRRDGGQQLNNGSLSLIRWRLVSKVEKREIFSQEGVQKRIWLVLRLV
jgi:hypothetical protein